MKTKDEFLTDVLARLRIVLPQSTDRLIPLHEPTFGGNEWEYIKECLDTRWVSSVGQYVSRFETELAEYTGAKFAVAVVNGTAALHMCLRLCGVRPDDEVLVPALTFIATANAVNYCGAVPHFVDCAEETLGLDPLKLELYLQEVARVSGDECFNQQSGRRIKAVVPMHTFGCPVDLDVLVDVCERYKLALVEDAAESLGSYYKGRHTGNWGMLSALSFNGNKIVTTGGGGAILCNDRQLAEQAKHLTTTAKLPHAWAFSHDEVGYNYRLPNINAALGVAQLEQIASFLNSKRQLAMTYQSAFAGCQSIQYFKEPLHSSSNYWLNTFLLDDAYSKWLDDLLALTNQEGIMTRPCWTPLHHQIMYTNCPRMDLSVTERLAKRIINVPSSASLGGLHG
ncbi:LegC family aminotransferase [Alicyclobacillus fastidiosus]|uniref:LegC family aminotransferase n=1 Tax=Alicyclobacillus fastidiosus TaxID=392011 RepID=A0ABY6ZAC1_9BACL|nr:LegC family aminotransferase [Alicyclobacillus fastidiosus]WAH39774.1 LegC family aminotransferase [Alicyclobacillus fastidiosus]GMA61016.1 perosamine synthetase [Alicyclobacillus fastidiosus]